MATMIPYLTQRAVDDYILPAIASPALQPYLEALGVIAIIGFAVVIVGYIADWALSVCVGNWFVTWDGDVCVCG